MITITRRIAQQVRSVFRRVFGTRGHGPALCFTAAAGTLSMKARSADTAVEYIEPASGSSETLWLPFQFLDDCGGKRDDPVHVEVTGKGRCTAQWHDASVPQIVQYDLPEPPTSADQFPRLPDALAENPPALLDALTAAGETTDSDAVRFAVNCLQLRGRQGSIGASDGRQILIQSGFKFPWEGDLLIPSSKVFGSPELAGDGQVSVGQSGDWVAFRIGAWTFWLAVNKDGRFPDLSRHILRPDNATARCVMSATDAAFPAQALPRLPTDDTLNHPITVDLNGNIDIRAKAADQAKPTEVVLSGSSWSGEPVRLNMNRKYLARALKLGFRELCIYGPTVPVVCHE